MSSAKRKSTRKRTWTESYDAMVAFKERHGHCNIPRCYAQDLALGQFAYKLRAKRFTEFTEEQRAQLDGIGFVWETLAESHERRWNEQLQVLKAYKTVHGNCCVPINYKENLQLARWVRAQRTLQDEGKLRADREAKLRALEFTWVQNKRKKDGVVLSTARADAKWEKRYEKLVEFRNLHGHTRVKKTHSDAQDLVAWVQYQRNSYTSGTLKADRIQKLELLDFEFRIRKKDGGVEVPKDTSLRKSLLLSLANNGGARCVVEAILKHGEEQEVLEAAWSVLCGIKTDKGVENDIVGGMRAIATYMKDHMDDATVQRKAMGVLIRLCERNSAERLKALAEGDGVAAVASVCQRHWNNVELFKEARQTMEYLLERLGSLE